jgi:PAS domain S-box-containing protein
MEDIQCKFSDFIHFEKLKAVLRRLCVSVKMGCCVVDPHGRIIIEEGWHCFCNIRESILKASMHRKCIDSSRFFSNNIDPECTHHVFTCKNGFSNVGAPIRIDGLHLASIFVGPFTLEAKHISPSGFSLEVVKKTKVDNRNKPPGCSPEKIQRIADHLNLFVELIIEMGRNHLLEKKTSNALKKSAEHYQDLINTLPQIIFETDRQRQILFFNRSATEILGDTEDILRKYKDLTFFFPKSDHEYLIDRFNRVLNREILPSTECKVRRVNGSLFPAMLSIRPIYDNGGNVSGIRGVLFDMSAHRQTEMQLWESEQRYRTLFDKSHTALLLIEDEEIIDCNIKAAKLFQISKDDLVGISFSSLQNSVTTRNNTAIAQKSLITALRQNEPTQKYLEWAFLRPDKVMVETEVSVNRIDLPDRNLMQMTLHDITGQKQDQRRLETRESAWNALFQHAPFGISVNRLTDGVYLDVNPSLLADSGKDISEFIGKSPYESLPESERSVAKHISKILLDKGSIKLQETSTLRKDGTIRNILYSAATFKSGDDVNAVSMIVDISERKEMERKLQESEARLQSLYRAVPIGLAVLKNRFFLAVNERLAEITGYSIDDLLSNSSRCLYHSDEDFENVGKFLYHTPDESGRGYVETRFRHKNGSTRHISLFAAPLNPDAPEEGAAVAIQDITEQRAMIIALQDSEERFRQVSDFSGQLMYDYDVPSGHVAWFGRVYEITGFTQKEIDVQSFSGWVERIHPDDLNSTIETLENAQRTRSLFTVHYRYRKADESYFYAYEEGRFFYDQQGNATRMLGTLKDITKTKLAEIALSESERRYRTLFEGASDAIIIMKDGVCVDCNQKTMDTIQCSRKDIIGKTPGDFAPPIQPDGQPSGDRAKQLLMLADQGDHINFEWVIRRPDNSTFFSDVSLRAVELSGESFTQAIIRDVTKKKKREKSLRESEFRFRSFFNTNPEGILLLDFQGRILDANKAFLRKSGYALAECSMQSFTSFIPEEHQAEIFQSLLKFRSGIAQSQPLQVTYKTKEGKEVPVSLRGWLVMDEESVPLYLGVFIRDLTREQSLAEDKMSLEKQVIRAQKSEAIGTLASGIAHDFNNILGGIIGYTELALYRDPAAIDQKTKEYLERVLKGSNRAKSLVQQILRFSRSTDTVMESINLSPLVKEALLLLQSTLPATISIDQNIHAVDDAILGDSTQIHQVIMNLATNAYHSMRETGGILSLAVGNCTLRTAKQFMTMTVPPGEYIKITVADTGCGMTPSVVERIFEPYFTTKNVNEGTGLGMAVVSGIVKSHKGLIDITTEPGKGTIFDIYFPRFQGELTENTTHELKLPLGHGEKILIVDDETYFLEVVHENLKMLGYNVEPYQDAVEALQAFSNQPHGYDLLITDQTMPEMTGVQLIQEVRKVNDSLPIILCTGFSEVVTEQSASYYGIDRFLMKPVNIHDIAHTVAQLLSENE